MAQGTVRFLSERSFFLLTSSIFGLDPLPFRIIVLTALTVSSILLVEIARKLTGSVLVGIIAICFWNIQTGLLDAVAWISAANQIFCSLFILAAFLAFLNQKPIWCWSIFLLGFGVLETIVVFPALLGVYCLLFHRERLKETLYYWIPALVFVWIRIKFLQNPDADKAYIMQVSPQDLFATMKIYISMAMNWWIFGALLAYTVWLTFRKNYTALFALTIFLFLLSPILPLKDHILRYYLAAPGFGLGLWIGVVFADLLKIRWMLGIIPVAFISYYFADPLIHSRINTLNWYQEKMLASKTLLTGIREIRKTHPDAPLLISGVPAEIYQMSMHHDFHRIFGTRRVFLFPEPASAEKSPYQVSGCSLVTTSMMDTMKRTDHALAYQYSGTSIQPLDHSQFISLSENLPRYSSCIQTGEPADSDQLISGWYPIDNELRWMGTHGSARLSSSNQGKTILISGYALRNYFNTGSPTLKMIIDGQEIGSIQIQQPDDSFQWTLQLPEKFQNREQLQITVIADHTFTSPDDSRPRSVLIRKIEILK